MSWIARRRSRSDRRLAGAWLLGVLVALLDSSGAGQQPMAPQTGAPRQLWPQRPGVFRPLGVEAPPDTGRPAVAQAPTVAPEFVPNVVLVQFEPDATETERQAARDAVGAIAVRVSGPDDLLERLTIATSVPDAAAVLNGMAAVDFAEPNWIVYREAVADDEYFVNGSLWGMYGDASTPANAFGSQAAELWAQGFVGSHDVYVAVIDEGIDISHPDLAPNIWANPFDPPDGVDNDGNGRIDDRHGWDFLNDDASVYDGGPGQPEIDSHGTHVAGTIGARGGNGIGVAGVSWHVKIISGKFLAEDGTGESLHAADALDYLVDLKTRHGLNIVAANNSWGGDQFSETLYRAIVRAANAGILVVAAAGNEGRDNDVTPHYPSSYSTLSEAGYEAVIAVASLTSSGDRSSFSNYGATTVDIGAPGTDIYSTWPQGQYRPSSGTSMAAPHVTGAAALYKAMYPAASASQIRSAILTQGAPTASMAGMTTTGHRLDVGAFHRFNLSVDGPTIAEGDSGTAAAVFTVSLSEPKSAPVSVHYATSDITAFSGTATGPGVSIPQSGRAVPFPSTVTVPTGSGVVTNVQVVLSGFSHPVTADLDVLLVGPGGQTCVLMTEVSGKASDITLAFDDAGSPLDPSTSGTYRPTSNGGAVLDSPAPPGPYGSSLSIFNGRPAAGTWQLFVFDDSAPVSGSLMAWSLSLTISTPDYMRTTGTLTFPANTTTQVVSVPVVGDTTFEPAETFELVLGDASGANVADDEAIATIRNDDFTDLALNGLLIRAVHILELRSAINEARTARGLAPFAFMDPALGVGTTVRAVHITQLRDALADMYADVEMSPPVYTDPTITPGVTIIKAAHITEIRAALLNLP